MRGKVGENMLDRLVRLLAKYEQDLGMVEGHVGISLKSDGSGTLFARFETIIEFENTAGLIKFLEADTRERIQLIRISLGV